MARLLGEAPCCRALSFTIGFPILARFNEHWQLCDVNGYASRLVSGEPAHDSTATVVVLEVDYTARLASGEPFSFSRRR